MNQLQSHQPECYNLDPRKFTLVFPDDITARRQVGPDFSRFQTPFREVIAADYETFGQGQDGRALAELMYLFLHAPSIFDHNRVHAPPSRFFGNVGVHKTTGRFHIEGYGTPESLTSMPRVSDLLDITRQIGYFPDIKSPQQKKYILFLDKVLKGYNIDPSSLFDSEFRHC